MSEETTSPETPKAKRTHKVKEAPPPEGPNQIVQLTQKVQSLMAENEQLRGLCQMLQTTVRTQAKFIQ